VVLGVDLLIEVADEEEAVLALRLPDQLVEDP
jgi:hypothetical protein